VTAEARRALLRRMLALIGEAERIEAELARAKHDNGDRAG